MTHNLEPLTVDGVYIAISTLTVCMQSQDYSLNQGHLAISGLVPTDVHLVNPI
jgi:hypothetical protein